VSAELYVEKGCKRLTDTLNAGTRDDGTMQYAYQGKPLYHYSKDQKPGDTMGHKFRDRWFVAQP
jgi:predicted lipoprotein with Yx(FWY)xxD motif